MRAFSVILDLFFLDELSRSGKYYGFSRLDSSVLPTKPIIF
jgi:hypothetical protein